VRKEEFDQFALQRPFKPFVVRQVDGRKFTFTSPEQFLVSRSTIFTLDRKGDGLLISLGLVATVHMKERNGNGRSRRRGR